jgi:hypothetical protein
MAGKSVKQGGRRSSDPVISTGRNNRMQLLARTTSVAAWQRLEIPRRFLFVTPKA